MQHNPILTIDRIFHDDEFKANSFGPARWLDDNSGYTTLEAAPTHDKVKEIVRYDLPSGERTVLVTAADLTSANSDKPLLIKGYDWSPDKRRLLLFTNSQKVWRQETRGDYWLLDLESKQLTQLGGEAESASLMFAKFSPTGGAVAYVRHNNIYVEELDTGEIRQLTAGGSPTLINGTGDWVYEEEFHLRDGFCWSPDGRFIAYWQFDTSGIESFYLINNTDSLYPQLTPVPYPKAGTINPAARIGIVPAAGGETTWLALPGDPRQHYLPKMEWAAASDQVLVQQLNRLQNQNRLFLGKASDGSVSLIHSERDEAWLDVRTDDVKWLAEGQAFTWISEQNGWRQLYHLSRDGQHMIPLTAGSYDVIRVEAVDEASDSVYFIASPEQASQRFLYRASVSGNGESERVTPPQREGEEEGGTHSYDISPGGKYAFHTCSSFGQPPLTSLITLPDHQTMRVLEANETLQAKVAALAGPPGEFFRVALEDGTELDGWCLKPPDFDPAQKYPLLCYVYGEPSGLTVLDNWGNKHYLWHRLLAQQGYLVMSVDNRGTPGPRGRSWRKSVYRQVGLMTTADQAAAVQALIRDRPYIDPGRVGVWGWSGGGTMTLNLLFQYPDLYKTGIAVAPVSDLRLYDTIYQERYMGLPDDNEAGYRDGSPITHAHQLQGNLLLIHGTGDDNVHYQATERLVNELIKHNKLFTMMAYPNRSHSISEGDNTSRHLYGLMTRFLQANL
jgi:dipeptidyl-peptidase-4